MKPSRFTRNLILGFIFFLFAAGLKAQIKDNPLVLDYFDKIPAQIDGCSGFYTYDSVSLKKEKYIVTTDAKRKIF